MIVAVPLFGSRISPHFGSSSTVAWYEVRNRGIVTRHIRHMQENPPGDPMCLARQIVASGADVLVCGGIQNQCREWMQHRGIRVLENHKGKAEEIVSELVATEPCFTVHKSRDRRE